MSSLKQADASRRNGSLSRGPVTPEGKARVSQNAAKHGMYSKVIVLASESSEQFQALLSNYTEEWQPVSGRERDLVLDLTITRWRLNRLLTIETATLDHEIDRQRPQIARDIERIDGGTRAALAFNTLADTGKGLVLLNRYESRLQRNIQRATEALEKLKEKRENKPGQ